MKHVTSKQAGPVVVITPRKNLLGGDECDELRLTAQVAAEQGNLRLVIDLGQIDYINSTGIGELTGIYASYRKREGRVVLANLHKKVKELLVMLHLVRVFDVYDSEEKAVESFTSAEAAPGTP
jgi:anti-sigma B factor antagonist